MMKNKTFLVVLLGICMSMSVYAQTKYTNPVYDSDFPDPSVQRSSDGTFYAYATGCRGLKSKNLVDWIEIENVISRPTWNDSSYVAGDGTNKTARYSFWACDVNRKGNKYTMYYSSAFWGNHTRTGIGVATGTSPDQFTDCGRMFRSTEVGVINSIDPCYVEKGRKKYLVWGSFHGIYCGVD